ncbi:MAG: hypothetical protein JO023_25110 [Chloroflexi bacterium]|nr:hypothetical protein [Chloroflexota bacterium]
MLAGRTAEREARFFLPYLRPGLRLLDLGCGPGTIMLGLARAVARQRRRAVARFGGRAQVHLVVADQRVDDGYRLPLQALVLIG